MKRSEFLRMMLMGAGGISVLPRSLRAEPFTDTVTPTLTAEEPVIDTGLYEAYQHLNAHFITRGPGLGNRVALTYDDGPTPGVTDIVLRELAKRRLKATFFMIGKKAEMYPALAREVVDAGHEIANHTYTHPALNRMSEDRVDYEIRKAQEVLHNITGKQADWFRPPYGAFRTNQGPVPLLYKLGVANWSVDPRDWARPGTQAIVDRIISQSHPGAIILLHDLHRQTADATGTVLDRLMERHYNLVLLTELMGQPYGPFYKPAS